MSSRGVTGVPAKVRRAVSPAGVRLAALDEWKENHDDERRRKSRVFGIDQP